MLDIVGRVTVPAATSSALSRLSRLTVSHIFSYTLRSTCLKQFQMQKPNIEYRTRNIECRSVQGPLNLPIFVKGGRGWFSATGWESPFYAKGGLWWSNLLYQLESWNPVQRKKLLWTRVTDDVVTKLEFNHDSAYCLLHTAFCLSLPALCPSLPAPCFFRWPLTSDFW